MTPIQKAAFVIAQVAMMNGEIAMMQVANQERLNKGEAIAYPESIFWDVYRKYEGTLGHNAVIEFFTEY